MINKCQREQIEKAKEQMQESMYAHIVALIEQADVSEVYSLLKIAAKDLGVREELEACLPM